MPRKTASNSYSKFKAKLLVATHTLNWKSRSVFRSFLMSFLSFQARNKFPTTVQRPRNIITSISQWFEECKSSNSSCILWKAGIRELILNESKRYGPVYFGNIQPFFKVTKRSTSSWYPRPADRGMGKKNNNSWTTDVISASEEENDWVCNRIWHYCSI